MSHHHGYAFAYAHSKYDKILEDVGIQRTDIPSFITDRMPYFIDGGTLYINTWIGRDSKFVDSGLGIYIESYVAMFNEIFDMIEREHKDIELTFRFARQESIFDYTPKIKFQNLFHYDKVEAYLRNSMLKSRILICNGESHSNQSDNFDMTPLIHNLVETHPERLFIVTVPVEKQENYSNLVSASEITQVGDRQGYDGHDLNEIAYLSTYCRLIVGRPSGPFVFTHVLENYANPDLTWLSLSKTPQVSDLLYNFTWPVAKRLFTPATDTQNLYRRISEILK